MYVIEARNVEHALQQGLKYLLKNGEKSGSRNGQVLVAPGAVTTVYEKPMERVLFWPKRDANPFFHLMESLWMLDGRKDVSFPAYFAGQIKEYSDDGESLQGAYGFRWRYHFGVDQIRAVVKMLYDDHTSRRAVIQMYDPIFDLSGGRDVPCNTVIYFRIRNGALHMTVSCRSNDIVWGAYGANAVHFSFLQEFIASQLKVEMGTYSQVSNNFHIYEKHWDLMDHQFQPPEYPAEVMPLASLGAYAFFLRDLRDFMNNPTGYEVKEHAIKAPFLKTVAQPMYLAWSARKNGTGDGLKELSSAPHCDWILAAHQWIERRTKK